MLDSSSAAGVYTTSTMGSYAHCIYTMQAKLRNADQGARMLFHRRKGGKNVIEGDW